jgi:hypothetical protein
VYKNTVMPPAKADLARLVQMADRSESGVEIRYAIFRTFQLLKQDALEAGEPLYDLKMMKMRICRIVSPPLYIEYGVHIAEPKAFIRRVTLIRKPA